MKFELQELIQFVLTIRRVYNQMSDNYSPNLFLFQSYITEVLKEGKKHIKTAPFDAIDPDTLLASDKQQHLDIYHQYFLSAMGHLKTREIACTNYQKLLRQGLVDRDHLPVSMISSVLTACSNVSGSTSGSSSLGSASLGGSPQGQILYIGSLIKAMLLGSYQPAGQMVVGLNYLLEGTRKKYSLLYSSMLEEVYAAFLVKFRESPMRRLIGHHLCCLLDQVEVHWQDESTEWTIRRVNEAGKIEMTIFEEKNGFGKFGKCFICSKQAFHYMKQEYVPICSISCRDQVKQLLQDCRAPEHFHLLSWLLDCLPQADDIIYDFLQRELKYYAGRQSLPIEQIQIIIKTAIHHLPNVALSKHLLPCLALVITRWRQLVLPGENHIQNVQKMQQYFKICYLEALTVVQDTPFGKQMLDYLLFFSQILRDDQIFSSIYSRYDCKFFESNVLARMLSLLSQYSKRYETALGGMHGLLSMLMRKHIERNQRNESWWLHGQSQRKKQLKKAIALFNNKPVRGIKYLKKIFQIEQQKKETQDNSVASPEIESSTYLEDSRVENFEEKDSFQSSPQKQDNLHQNEEIEEMSDPEEQEDIEQMEKVEAERQPISLNAQQIINEKIDELIREGEAKGIFAKPKNENTEELNEQAIQQAMADHQEKKEEKQEEKKEEKKEQKKQEKKKEKPIHTKLTPKDIAILIMQNLEYRTRTPTDNKLPIEYTAFKKIKVGEYFGSDDAEARQICQQFLNLFPFEQIQIDNVLRICLNTISLPKQTQQIERIINDLSIRLAGQYGFVDDKDNNLYVYIYLLLMVQTSNHNPNVKASERLNLQSYLNMSKAFIENERAEVSYHRIIEQPLDVRMKYSEQSIFHLKYLDTSKIRSEHLFAQPFLEGSLTKDIMVYIWQYLIIGLIWPGNTRGLWESVVLLGRQGLADQQTNFFEALRKQGKGREAGSEINGVLLRLGIEFGNELHGRLWDYIITLIYGLQNQNEYNSAVLDKLFTNSGQLAPPRLRDFIHSLLLFSTSEFKKDTHYTRQLFVLRHINSILEYNIPRFGHVALQIWGLLDRYFRDICLHPRREIAMAAIDSFKQLTLKLFKLRDEPVQHEAIMETYLYVFERSCLQMKDLVANVLLNLITPDMRGGWQPVYSIMDVLDTRDSQLVVRIVRRCINQVGLARLTSLPKLHAICIKELRVCGEESAIEGLLGQVWELSQFIDDTNTWVETVRSIKDIFKISLNHDLMVVFVRMSNRCLQGVAGQPLHREIFAEIVDLLMFLLEIRGPQGRAAGVLLSSLEALRLLSSGFIIQYLGGSCGFLSVYQMYLSCENKLPFALFLKEYLLEQLLPSLVEGGHWLQWEQLALWAINVYYDNLPLELVNLRDRDPDFEVGLQGLLKQEKAEGRNELIEFHLSHKDYYEKSVLHLVFLDIVQQIYKQAISLSAQHDGSAAAGRVSTKVIESVVDSYECAVKINKLVLLRNFLWNNGFLSAKTLPGLHKQQHRTLSFVLRHFPFTTAYPLLIGLLRHYLTVTTYLQQLNALEAKAEPALIKVGPVQKRKPDERNEKGDKEGRSYSIYINDASLWMKQAEKSMAIGLVQLQWQLKRSPQMPSERSEWIKLQQLCLSLLSVSLPANLCAQTCETLHTLVQLLG